MKIYELFQILQGLLLITIGKQMQLTLNIKENKVEAFINFIKTLDYVSIQEDEVLDIPQWQQDIVLDRMKSGESNLPEEEFYKLMERKLNEKD